VLIVSSVSSTWIWIILTCKTSMSRSFNSESWSNSTTRQPTTIDWKMR
jgi:hypothetical protein